MSCMCCYRKGLGCSNFDIRCAAEKKSELSHKEALFSRYVSKLIAHMLPKLLHFSRFFLRFFSSFFWSPCSVVAAH